MNLPKTIKIGGHNYEVIFPYVFTERNDLNGDIDDNKKIIRLVGSIEGEKRVDSALMVTLIHEILHGLDHTTGQRMFAGDEGEKKIEALSEGIYQVLVVNGYLPNGLEINKNNNYNMTNTEETTLRSKRV